MERDPTEEAEPGCPLQDLLPPELRETLAQTLPLTDRLAWRRCSRPLRDAFDASNTAVSVCDEVGGEALLGLVRRMPRLASLEVAALWPGVDWHGVLSGADRLQALRVGWPMRGSRAAVTPPAQGVLRTIGEACGATLRRLELQPLFDLEFASWLAPCTALTRLALKMCPMQDLDALASCATLQEVEVTMCHNLEDIGGLASSGATLERLDMSMTGVSDLAPLASCRGLRRLDVGCTKVADLAPLASCTALRRLDMWYTKATDLAPLASCTALEHLNIRFTRASDVAPLASCTALQHLDVGGGGLVATGFSALAACTALRVLRVQSCGALADLRFVAALTALEELRIAMCANVADLAPLAACTALRLLDAKGCTGVTDVRSLASCTALETLNLCRMRVSCVAALAACPRLRVLGGGRPRQPGPRAAGRLHGAGAAHAVWTPVGRRGGPLQRVPRLLHRALRGNLAVDPRPVSLLFFARTQHISIITPWVKPK